MSERRYAMTRMRAGDYLLPSNDATVLWRVAKYREDGSAQHDDGSPVFGEFWGLWRWRGFMSDRLTLDWVEWDMWAQGFTTRGAAVAEAMSVQTKAAS